MALDPRRTVAELGELARLTGDERGAQRLAWTPTWARAREWLRARLAELPVEVEGDAAGNLWATLPGGSPRTVVVGSHLDSVPDGGWLDGTLGVLAALAVLRRLADAGEPPLTVRLVDWADEEGARFGRSLIGSDAAAGLLDGEELAGLTDRDGVDARQALAAHGVELARMGEANAQLADVVAYLELHIEQGVELERRGLPVGVVSGVLGVARHAVRFQGETAHAGATALELRRDALLSAARLALEVREIARRHGGRGTSGDIAAVPGIVTAVAGEATLLVDQRHETHELLADGELRAREAADRIAADERTVVEWDTLLRTAPVPFDPLLVGIADDVVTELAGEALRIPSGALHDAAAVARAGVPAAMLFARSIGGRSHTREEDTHPKDLETAVRALDALVDCVLRRLA
ncbi:MAG TPA: Zn-dependent hydrolase [Thermoleophilaceae bacterium]|nr:Zn-dependent hydrolase [Thermoleophilaceae bacterium]